MRGSLLFSPNFMHGSIEGLKLSMGNVSFFATAVADHYYNFDVENHHKYAVITDV